MKSPEFSQFTRHHRGSRRKNYTAEDNILTLSSARISGGASEIGELAVSSDETTLAKDRIDHIAISVADVKSAVEWYTSKFNCRIKYQDETWAYLGFDNINLALVVPGQHPSHLAFIREDAEKYGALKTHRDGTKSCYVNDPAGNAIEIMEPYLDS